MFKVRHKITRFLCYDNEASDGVRVAHLTQAMVTMARFDIAALQCACEGG